MLGHVSLCVVCSVWDHNSQLPDHSLLYGAQLLPASSSTVFHMQLTARNYWQLAFQRHQAAKEQITSCELNFLCPERVILPTVKTHFQSAQVVTFPNGIRSGCPICLSFANDSLPFRRYRNSTEEMVLSADQFCSSSPPSQCIQLLPVICNYNTLSQFQFKFPRLKYT